MIRKSAQLPLSKKTLKLRIDTLINSLPGVNFDAAFAGVAGQSDLASAVQRVDGLPAQLTTALFKQFVRRRKDGSSRNCRNANIWLRERTGWVKSLIQVIPVDPHQLRDDSGRQRVADSFANQTAAIWHHIELRINAGEPVSLPDAFDAVRQPADQWGFIAATPRFADDAAQERWILSVMVRLLSAKWWAKRINRCWDRLQEHIHILLGDVRKGVSAYVSNATLKVVRERKRAMMRWLADSEVMNAQYDLVISMKDCWE
ncbi:MAG: replication endonuclease, partial [Aeromonas sp.]